MVAHDGIHTLVVDVAFLDAQVKRVAVDGHAIGERHHFVVDKQSATDGSELFPIIKYLTDGFTLHHLAVGTLEVADGLGVVAPALQQLQALGKQGGLYRAVFVFRVESGKLGQVLTFRSQGMPRKIDDVLLQTDVVIALGQRLAELKLTWKSLLQEVDSWLIQIDDAEGLVMGKAFVAQRTDGAFQTTLAGLGHSGMLNTLGHWRQWHGVGVLTVIDEPQHQISLDDGILQSVVVPREQVNGAPLAALDIVPPQIRADDVQVLKAYRLILDHQVKCWGAYLVVV